MKKLYVVIPCYNEEEVLNETAKRLEVKMNSMIEEDLIEAIIQLPENMFYNTGITTYIWILSNRKEKRRKGNG